MSWPLRIACLAPMVYIPWLWYPQSEGGHVVFQAAVLLGLLSLRPLKVSFMSMGLLAWAITIILSTLFSSDPIVTLFSSHMRGEGALQHLHYVAFLALLLSAKKIDLRWLVFGGVGCVLWGLLPMGWMYGSLFPIDRLRGNLGNPLYLATGLTFTLWAALRLRWWHVAIPLTAAMVATQSKGAILGLVVAFIFWLWTTRRYALGCALTLALMAGMLAIPTPSSGNIRIGMWDAAVRGIAERPLRGWGAENYPLVWDKYFIPITTEVTYAGPDARVEVETHYWHDRAHNVALDRAIEWGIGGLVVWVCLLLSGWRRGDALDKSAAVLYAVQAVFMFDMMFSMVGACVWIAWCWRQRD